MASEDVRKVAKELVEGVAMPPAPNELEPLEPAPPVELEPGLRVVEPLRPDLRPGETIMTVPERWCPKCEQARGGKICPKCRTWTEQRLADGELAEEYEKPEFVRRHELESEDEEEPMRVQVGEDARDEVRTLRAMIERMERERDEEIRQRITRAQRFPQRTERVMAQTTRQQRRQPLRTVNGFDAEDDEGVFETVSRREGGGRRRKHSAEDMYEGQWKDGSINTAQYVTLFAAIVHGAQTLEDVARAAELADEAYIQIMARQQRR